MSLLALIIRVTYIVDLHERWTGVLKKYDVEVDSDFVSNRNRIFLLGLLQTLSKVCPFSPRNRNQMKYGLVFLKKYNTTVDSDWLSNRNLFFSGFTSGLVDIGTY